MITLFQAAARILPSFGAHTPRTIRGKAQSARSKRTQCLPTEANFTFQIPIHGKDIK